jgi:hypothetical protein
VQFGRDITKYYNTTSKVSEIQLYFFSDSQQEWPKILNPAPAYLLLQVTRRPLLKSKTNFHSLLVAHLYFPSKRLFLPLFFCLMQNEQPSYESYLKALTKF